jgi:hypothetical protein
MPTRKMPTCAICGRPAAALLTEFPVCESCHAAITSDVDICFECHAVLKEGEEVFCKACDPGDPPPIDWEAEAKE